MSEFDPFNGSPRLCKIKVVVIDGESVIDRRELFALCKGKEDRDRLIYQLYAERRDTYGPNVEIFTDYKWETLVMSHVRFQAVEEQILMWTIRCNGSVMGRAKDMEKAVVEMSRMIDSLGKSGDKWSLCQE